MAKGIGFRKVSIPDSSLYFDLLGTISLIARSLANIKKEYNKSDTILFKQLKLLREEGYIFYNDPKKTHFRNEKFYMVDKKKIAKVVYDFLYARDPKIKAHKEEILNGNGKLVIDFIVLMKCLKGKDYTLNLLIMDYFNSGMNPLFKSRGSSFVKMYKASEKILKDHNAIQKNMKVLQINNCYL